MNSKSRAVYVMLICCMAATGSAQRVSKISFPVSSVVNGAPANGTVELSAKVAKTAVVVTLTSSNPAVVVPASVSIAPGQATAPVSVTTTSVAADTTVVIKATVGTTSSSTSLVVQSPRVAGFTFTTSTAQGGSNATGMVKLNSAAPAGGLKVNLSANSPLWGGPTSIVVSAGTMMSTFTFATIPVVGITDVNVAASVANSRVVANLNITPALFTSFRIATPSVVGGTNTTGMLFLNGPAPKEGFRINLRTDSPLVKVPGVVVIPSGKDSTTFTITTKVVPAKKTARISAGGSGASVELSLDLTPAPAGTGTGH